jgi:hypothetical protein
MNIMKLDNNTNYIVSGLERSGTSMLMQILVAGGAPTAFDTESRPPDDNNPKGYFELEGGKIINKLMEGQFPMQDHRGKFIKITAYGLKFLPPGNYKIIYSQRNIDEILDSMEKMAKVRDDNREETREIFIKLNSMIIDLIKAREDVDVLFVDYNRVVSDPAAYVREIHDFLGTDEADLEKMVATVDGRLYRKRRQ